MCLRLTSRWHVGTTATRVCFQNWTNWQGGRHELDFVLGPGDFMEVKRGRTGPLDFAWFPKSFPEGRLTVVSASRFETDRIVGMTLEDFLLGGQP
jgi:hypothetical protein